MIPHRVQARHLQKGDRVAFGQTVKWVGVGTTTPKGKVEVVLVKDNGESRISLWNAGTIITAWRES